jgi:lipopolysaccharide biosynthesis regulator YciM
VSETALLGVAVAAIAGLLAGRAWNAAAAHEVRRRSTLRASPHYAQGVLSLALGRVELARSELTKAARDEPEAVDVTLVLGTLLRETGQVERAVQLHHQLLARPDLTRAERGQALLALGTDFRKAGFLDRAAAAFEEVLALDPGNVHALTEVVKLHEEQRQWQKAYEVRTRLQRLRKVSDHTALGFLQAEIGREALRAGRLEEAEMAFQTALSLDRRVFAAHLGLAELNRAQPARAVAILEDALQIAPEKAYLAFEGLAAGYAALGDPGRFAAVCERIIRDDPRDFRARLALARHLRAQGQPQEALGLLLRALETSPQALLVHLETWRTLRAVGLAAEAVARYLSAAESSLFYRDPHVCTTCRYRADDMLWRCPHCHEWNTFVEDRLAPEGPGTR